ncbi:MAG: hypothetical protein LiPW15_244 [Parcubacteria group bacterium LiPW_15]|nr:MAG: hypothetical protein LiPW15_244 [Parcubacteria group bacterium LiPW_15]
MDEPESWLDGGMYDELAGKDLGELHVEVDTPIGLDEEPIGDMTEGEKRFFHLWAYYILEGDEAEKRGDNIEATFCRFRAGIIRIEMDFRITERLRFWEAGINEVILRSGWKIVRAKAQNEQTSIGIQALFGLASQKNDKLM